MKLRNVGIAFAPLLLAACATQYVEPQGPDTATLTIQNAADMRLAIFAYNVAADCSGGRPKIADTPALAPGQSVTFKVKGNEAFSFFAGFAESTVLVEKNCFLPLTFTPRSGEKYIARFTVSGGRCYPAIVSTTAAGERKEPFRLRKIHPTMTASGAACD